jgi:uncharacterized protein YjbI with pentapeptide repeats
MSVFMDETYSGRDFATTRLKTGEYDNCTFTNCNFSNTHLSNCTFLECTFTDCNFTNVQFGGTTFTEIFFEQCKLLGADFSACNDFMLQIRFRESILNLSIFMGVNLSNTHFDSCPLKEADFTEATLTGAHFEACDLHQATFEQTNLEKADFTTAYNILIDPEKNKMKGAKFSKENVAGLLEKYKISIQ